jgi:predicted dehydrogenase
MDKVRIGVIGLGNMGSGHAGDFVPKSPGALLTAVCDIVREKCEAYEGVAKFTSSAELIRSGLVDAIIIATPHYDHTPIGIDAFENGIHVLVEKPISAHVADGDRLIAAKPSNLVFSVMFQTRTSSAFQTIKKVIQDGELGEIKRVNWIVTNWFRSAAYYASSEWRATWKGEGGGVLLNQCPHNLDLYQWLFGMPKSVTAFCGYGKYHEIEVEDAVTAYFEYPSGATGVFITTTGEAPGSDRLEIAGDRGRLVFEKGLITFDRTNGSVQEYSDSTPESFPSMPTWKCEIPYGSQGPSHMKILANFLQAIQTGAPLIAPGEEGIKSLELTNAMLLSSWQNKTVRLPIDREEYLEQLGKRIAESTLHKKVSDSVVVDMAASFH